jgi:hypothetical protein
MPNLSDTEPLNTEPNSFWNFLVVNLSILNLSDTEPIWYRTHLILNPSDTEPISWQDNKLSETEHIRYRTYNTWDTETYLIPNLSDTEPIRYRYLALFPSPFKSLDDRRHLLVRSIAKLVTKKLYPSPSSPSQLTLTSNPLLARSVAQLVTK